MLDDEEPTLTYQLPGEEFHFFFVVDRSGSMSGSRILKAIEALKLFLRSLPKGCLFTVISFGTEFTYLKRYGSNSILYNEESMQEAIEQIESFKADLGGTDIATPLTHVHQWDQTTRSKKRIFVLTDGVVSNKDVVISAVDAYSEVNRVFTFGLGSGCDVDLV